MSVNLVDINKIDVEHEAGRLYQQLLDFGDDAIHEGDASAMNTYVRLSTQLFEKLIEIQERARSVKQVEQFQNMVLEIMEDELTADQRTRVMEQLKCMT